MTRAVTPATLGAMPYHQDDDEPTRANVLGVGLAILAAIIGAAMIIFAAVGTALIVIVNTL